MALRSHVIEMEPFVLYSLAGLVVVYVLALIKRRRHRFPPGPRGLPFVANLFDAPSKYAWLQYRDWARQYGALVAYSEPVLSEFRWHAWFLLTDSDIVHLETLGMHVYVLHSAEATRELFDKRSNIYSDR